MSQTIDIGIDLGTTNSVVAGLDNGSVRIIKNALDRDITPSIIGIDSNGEIRVGDEARDTLLSDPENAVTGFKRQLGTQHKESFPKNGKEYSMEELASILLSQLLRDSQDFLNETPRAAVITVPAVFGEIEKYSVIQAGKRSGLEQVELVQEPVAAGLAYGWDRTEDERPFLVFDIGGGTFDLSLMQCIGGQLIVLNHQGLHTLGGREIDSLLLSNVINPWLQEFVAEEELQRMRHLLLYKCQMVKERLSQRDTATFGIEGKLKSFSGDPVNEVFILNRYKDLYPLLRPLLQETTLMTRNLLSESSVNPSDLSSVVLVGGPTKTPALREHLEREFPDVVIHTRIDPMTVVAQGAALFGGSIKKTVTFVGSSTENAVPIRIEYDPISSTTNAIAGIAVDSDLIPDGSQIRVTRSDGEWSGGIVEIKNGRAIINLVLQEKKQSTFAVHVFDQGGGEISIIPSEITITNGLVAAPPPLGRSIGVVVESGSDTSNLGFSILAKKGVSTPFTHREIYKTTFNIGPAEPDSELSVRFREGESNQPLRNREIGVVRVEGSQLERLLPTGSAVEITIRIDPSSQPTARVSIPYLALNFENKLELVYEAEPDAESLETRLYSEEMRIRQLSEPEAESNELLDKVWGIQKEIGGALTGDKDSISRAKQGIEQLETIVDEHEEKLGPHLAMSALDSNEQNIVPLVEEYGDQVQKDRLQVLVSQANTARSRNDGTFTRHIADGIWELGMEVYWSQDGAWVAQFRSLSETSDSDNNERIRQLIREGEQAIASGDMRILKGVVIDLQELSSKSSRIDDPFARFRGLRAT